MRDPIEKNKLDESLLQTMEEGPQVQEKEEIPIECELIDSDNEVNHDDFHYDKNASKHALELDVGGEQEKCSDEVKLVLRRPPSNTAIEVQPSTPKSNFQYMPTPGIGIKSASQFNNYGPPLNQPGSSTMVEASTTSIPLQSLVEDLQDIENQEKARKRAAMIKNKRVVRGSITFAPPRMKKIQPLSSSSTNFTSHLLI
ncbi:unnamed protein product [Fraxinus pennsylvanica]|uniref:Uncharacterized protein n=1 Tax=Fraxinus pennsylvanica TaxID=56036 RepID=A0AAD2AAY7_9LAMI|nr:unnamed protein product [Fraxinus pennsylvanica]